MPTASKKARGAEGFPNCWGRAIHLGGLTEPLRSILEDVGNPKSTEGWEGE